MKAKRIVALLMATIMTVSLAACGETKESESDNVQTEDATEEEETEAEETETEEAETVVTATEEGRIQDGDVPETLFDEALTIDFALWDQTSFESDPYSDYIATKFNVDFEIRNEDWGNYEEQIALWGASDDMPDIFTGYIDESYFGDFIDQELIRDIPLETLKKYPNAYNRWLNDPTQQALYEYYGKIYYLSRDDGHNCDYVGSYTGGQALYYRADWAEALGFDEPTNMDELLEMLIAFAKEDPDGNGVDDTYGLDTSFGRLEAIWSWFNCYPSFWVESEEGYIPGYLDKENMVEALTWLRTAYENGAVDPEWNGDIQGFVDDKFGAYNYHCDMGWSSNIICSKFGSTHEGNPYDIVNAVTCLPVHEGEEATTRPYYTDGMACFSYDCSDEAMERMLAIYDWACDGYGWIFTQYGFEGTDYTVDESGKLTRVADNPRSKSQNMQVACFYTWGGECTDLNYINISDNDNKEADGVTDEFSFQFARNMHEKANEAAQNEEVTFALLPTLIQTQEKNSFVFDEKQGLLDIVVGTDDVETMYDAFVQSAYDSGVQNVIDSINNAM